MLTEVPWMCGHGGSPNEALERASRPCKDPPECSHSGIKNQLLPKRDRATGSR